MSTGLHSGISAGGAREAGVGRHPAAPLPPGAEVRSDAEERRAHVDTAAVVGKHAPVTQDEQV